MKTILTTLTVIAASCLLGAFPSLAQYHVTEAVADAFTEKYPAVADVHYQVVDGNFEAQFKDEGTEVAAVFTFGGEFLATKKKLASKDVPADVLEKAKANYASYKVEHAFLVESLADGNYHQLVLTNNEKSLQLNVFANGKLMVSELAGK